MRDRQVRPGGYRARGKESGGASAFGQLQGHQGGETRNLRILMGMNMQFTYTPKAPKQDDDIPQLMHVLTGKDTHYRASITINKVDELGRLELSHHHYDGHSTQSRTFTAADMLTIAKGLIDAAAALIALRAASDNEAQAILSADPTAIEQDGPSA